jgi:hypothetical protein
VRRWFQFGSKSVQRESRRFDAIGAARMTGRGVTRVLYTWYNPLRVSLPMVRETFPRLCGRWLFSLFVVRSVLIRLLFVSVMLRLALWSRSCQVCWQKVR